MSTIRTMMKDFSTPIVRGSVAGQGVRARSRHRNRLRLETLEKRNLLAGFVVAPIVVDLDSVNGSFLQSTGGAPNWINGSGLDDSLIVRTGDPIPSAWPTHAAGHDSSRVTRIRDGNEFNTLTFELSDAFDINGMVLWNGSEPNRPSRGFENTVLSYSTDGGINYSGSDTLTWMNRSEATINPDGHLPEVQMLPATVTGVTHIKMVVDNFSISGNDRIVAADEIRFLAEQTITATSTNLSVNTANGDYDLTQGKEGSRAIEFTVTLNERNLTGAPITFDLEDLGTGTATSGLDYDAIPVGTQISVPNGSFTGILSVNVIDDLLIEATEIINARISNPSQPSITLGITEVAAKIGDNDTAGVTLVGADGLSISEAGATDTYTIGLATIPTGPVEITATSDSQTQVSSDGVNFTNTVVLNFTDNTPQIVTVRAVDDQAIEDAHGGAITHAITGAVIDPNYPDVRVEDLYTQTGTDRSFQELIDSGDLPTGSNTTAGITGSTINVNNAVVEQGVHADTSIPQNTNIHTLANSVIRSPFFNRWTRWYQEDGNTQVYRVFEGEENVRNSRGLAARIESHLGGWRTGVWNDFSARYTLVKAESMAIFQSFQPSVEWSVHIGMDAEGNVKFTHRRANGGGQLSIPLAEDMVGKSFDIRIRENGLNYEVYFNGELKGVGEYEKPDSTFSFRWGMYRGSRPMTRDAMLFVTGASMQANTSAPADLVPYRPATTSLSIANATAEIADNDDGSQTPVIEQTVQDGTVINAEQFDLGGQDIAYNDTTVGNRGGSARPDEDVDLFAGSVVLSDIADGEWLEFTRDVVPGVYDIDVRAWSTNANNKGVRILIAEDSAATTFTELGSVNVPDTGNSRITQTIPGVDLTDWGGEDRVFRVEFFGSGFSYDWIEFKDALDFGDAPESYSTLLANDGARHVAIGPQLGATRDTESDGAPSFAATDDGNDEDGVLFGGIAVNSMMAAVNIELAGATEGRVDAWVDFNRDGEWDDALEKVLDSVLVNQATQTLNYSLPSNLTVGENYARVRISTNGNLGPKGFAYNGEVEDYVVRIIEPPVVESIQINKGESQRSSLDSIRVTFDQVVNIDTSGGNPFQLIHADEGDAIPTLAPVISSDGDKTFVDLAFGPAGLHVTDFGSLEDGDYRLVIDSSFVMALGVKLDGDGNGSAGDPYVMNAVDGLFRMYGDSDGDGRVGLADFAAFRSTFGRSDGQPDYLYGLDSDGDQTIGLADFAAFRANFGT